MSECIHRRLRLCSIWSVDLAHLLRRFSVEVQYLTVTIGANPGFAMEKFYKVSRFCVGPLVLVSG
jgi:hypothetical protein